MTKEERKKKIEQILSIIKINPSICEGIPIKLWIISEIEPANPAWVHHCQQAVNWYFQEYGKKDTESLFSEFIKKQKLK